MFRVLLLPLLALVLLAGGCGSDDAPASAPSQPRKAAHSPATSRTTSEPAPSPSRAAPPTPTRSRAHHQGGKSAALLPMARRPIGAHLLTGDRMPGLAEGFSWRVVASGPEDARAVGACQKTALESIGAVSAVRRTFAGSGRATASQVVAKFADKVSAARAHAVLLAWRADCEERLESPRASVGELRTVTVHRGTGESYRSELGQRSQSRGLSTGLGIVWKGSWLSVVEVSTHLSDYPRRVDPARAAVRRIARTFI